MSADAAPPSTEESLSEAWRPRFHYTAARHWINDPNGLVYFDGEYHLHYQCNPFGDQWGHMSWGHAVSPDLLHWRELPVAIPEDERVSIFSGSAVVDAADTSGFGDGTGPVLVAAYTGCLRRPEGGQAQELAYSRDRGRTWTKHAGNPVLDLGRHDFRDPKVFWHAPSARWVMATVLPDERAVLFHASDDLKAWQALGRFDSDERDAQGIWECPDLIELSVEGGAPSETAWMLKVDVFEGHPSGGSGARLYHGHFDGHSFTAEPSAHRWADHGADFYAALSWSNLPAEPPRQVWIGWMNCHRYAKLLPTSPWRGAMSLPRELVLRRDADGLRLLQRPVRELAALRTERYDVVSEARALTLADGAVGLLPPGCDARALEIDLRLRAGDCAACGLVLRADSAGRGLRIVLDRQRGTVAIDRGGAGFLPEDPLYALPREAPCPSLAEGRAVRLRVWLDRSSAEVFIDDGETVLTEQFLPDPDALGTWLFAEGGTARVDACTVHALSGSRDQAVGERGN